MPGCAVPSAGRGVMRKSDVRQAARLISELDGCRAVLRAVETTGCPLRVSRPEYRLGCGEGMGPNSGFPAWLEFQPGEIIPALRAAVARLEGELRSLGVLL